MVIVMVYTYQAERDEWWAGQKAEPVGANLVSYTPSSGTLSHYPRKTCITSREQC